MNTYFLTASRDMIFASKQTFVQSQVAALIAASLAESFDVLTMEDVSKVMSRLDITGVTHIAITDADGKMLYPADSYAVVDDSFTAANVMKALEGYDVFYSKLADGAFYSSAFMPVMNRETVIGSVYVHDFDIDQGAILLDMQNTLKNISVITVLLSVAMVVFIIWSVMHRITSILKAIKSVREGEYNYRISMNGNDELALLGDEFNSLTNRLRETEEIRRRFVANASHELKTPLASIRLLSDSILHNEGMDHETVREFISDIGAEAERLSRITEKLMTLTRLDSNIIDEQTKVDIRNVLNSTLRMLKPLADNYGVTFSIDLDENCTVYATEDSIHQVVFNLLENAVKYNNPYGVVSVKLKREKEHALFTVDDMGIGVPEEDLPFIFDRFYRVDKARSREAGGSGLGLSIVMDTVRDLGGTVSALQLPGGGMRFQVLMKIRD